MTTADELALRLLALLDGFREQHRKGHEIPPTLYVETPEEINAIPLTIWTEENKRPLMYALGRRFGRRVTSLALITDAWVKEVTREEADRRLREGGPQVRNMPGRGEGLVGIAMTDAGQTIVVEQLYTREGDEIIYEEPRRGHESEEEHKHRAFVLEPFWRGAGIWKGHQR